MPKKHDPPMTNELQEVVDISTVAFDGEQMDLHEFASKFRAKVQGHLWSSANRVTVAELIKLVELEKETEIQAVNKRPRELRVIWINQKKHTT
jgi:hypothetical protein